ncbi:MAG: lactonase family protein [Verrucomicrobiales bacterium]|nr:lactonase family protein [Verrucomicrobiales bacterium]
MFTQKFLSFALAASALLTLSASAEPKTVYFGTGGKGAEGIYQATFNPDNGKWTPSKLAAKIGSPGFLALHPDGDKLYAVGRWEKNNGVIAYKIKKNGDLEEFAKSVNPDGGGAHIAIHPSGKFLLTAQYGGGSVALFPLTDDGKPGEAVVTEHEGGSNVVPKRQESPHPHWCGFSPDAKYAFVPDLGLDQIVIYKVDAETPSITKHGVARSVPGGGPRHMRFSIDGKYIYLLNELTLSVTTFSWDPKTGTAERLSTTPALSEETKAAETFNSAAEILVHPSGKYVYSSNRGHDTVTVYQADPATGKLEVVQVQPIRGAFPRNINLDPTSSWLLAAGADSNTVAAHSIDPETGKLTYQRGSIINVPAPICILFAK